MYYSEKAINLNEAKKHLPMISQTEASSKVSGLYSQIPTIEVLRALEGEGFQIHGLTSSVSRKIENRPYAKHLIRMRQEQHKADGYAPELIVINSHDGTQALQLRAGLYRFACANGLIVGSDWINSSIRHINTSIEEIIDVAYETVNQFERIQGAVDQMSSKQLSSPDQQGFAEEALQIRYKDKKRPIKASQLLIPRRYEDRGDDTFSIFNRIQENLMRGGLHQDNRGEFAARC